MSHRLAHAAARPRWYCVAEAQAGELMTTTADGAAGDLRLPLQAFGIELPAGVLQLEMSSGLHSARVVVVAECDSSQALRSYYDRGRHLTVLVRCEENRNSRPRF